MIIKIQVPFVYLLNRFARHVQLVIASGQQNVEGMLCF